MPGDFAVDNKNLVVDKIRFTLRALTFFIDKPRRDRYAFLAVFIIVHKTPLEISVAVGHNETYLIAYYEKNQ